MLETWKVMLNGTFRKPGHEAVEVAGDGKVCEGGREGLRGERESEGK